MERSATERTAEAVRVELARHRVKGSDMAKELRLSRTTMWRRLNGEYPFNIAELSGIADRLGVPVSTFLPEQDAA